MISTKLIKNIEKMLVDNSPTILTGAAVVGTLTSVYLTGTATVKAIQILEDESWLDDISFKDKAKLTWKCYIPAAGMTVATITCTIGANRIGTRRAAAMASAYMISDKAFNEYREKVAEKFGEGKERKVKDEVAQDQVSRSKTTADDLSEGTVLCYDQFSGRYFESKMEDIKWAQNHLNHTVINSGYASLGDFYSLLQVPSPEYAEELGWTSDELLELEFSTVLSDDAKPCLAFRFRCTPVRDYYKFL